MPAVSNNALGPFTHVRRIDYEEMKRVLGGNGLICIAEVPVNSVIASVLISITKPFQSGVARFFLSTDATDQDEFNTGTDTVQYLPLQETDSAGTIFLNLLDVDQSLISGEVMIGLQILDLQQFAK